MKKSNWTWPTLLLMLAMGWASCKDEGPLPPNPYDDVDYGDSTSQPYTPDPNSFLGIYENILSVKCANPGCHDGHFEPDFRTPQTSWSTLVYHKLVKNTSDSAYTYRVVPYDTGSSIFWYRINRGDAQLQRMPATGNYVTSTQLQNIRTWIDNGARDMFGNLPVMPNAEPQIMGFIAFNQSFTQQIDVTNNRLDSIPYNPFKVADNTQFNVVILVEDDSTLVENLQVNQLKLSMQKDNFAGASVVNAYFLTLGNFRVWVAPVNTAPYAVGDTVYMRYYVNDGDQPYNTEFPRTDSQDPYKTYAAFYINQ